MAIALVALLAAAFVPIDNRAARTALHWWEDVHRQRGLAHDFDLVLREVGPTDAFVAMDEAPIVALARLRRVEDATFVEGLACHPDHLEDATLLLFAVCADEATQSVEWELMRIKQPRWYCEAQLMLDGDDEMPLRR